MSGVREEGKRLSSGEKEGVETTNRKKETKKLAKAEELRKAIDQDSGKEVYIKEVVHENLTDNSKEYTDYNQIEVLSR